MTDDEIVRELLGRQYGDNWGSIPGPEVTDLIRRAIAAGRERAIAGDAQRCLDFTEGSRYERAAIVAWLKSKANEVGDSVLVARPALLLSAEYIERGAHLEKK